MLADVCFGPPNRFRKYTQSTKMGSRRHKDLVCLPRQQAPKRSRYSKTDWLSSKLHNLEALNSVQGASCVLTLRFLSSLLLDVRSDRAPSTGRNAASSYEVRDQRFDHTRIVIPLSPQHRSNKALAAGCCLCWV